MCIRDSVDPARLAAQSDELVGQIQALEARIRELEMCIRDRAKGAQLLSAPVAELGRSAAAAFSDSYVDDDIVMICRVDSAYALSLIHI